jgi:branched-chain amino acid transport system substrate-binding protein
VSLLTGEPEYLDPLKDESPTGWLVTGYPWYAIKTPEHNAFKNAYETKYKDYPRLGSVVGYSAIMSLAAGIKKAQSTETEKLITAFRGLTLMSPFGSITYRPEDHQSTMGGYVGRTKLENGKGVMGTFRYIDGTSVLPSAEEVKKLRPAD